VRMLRLGVVVGWAVLAGGLLGGCAGGGTSVGGGLVPHAGASNTPAPGGSGTPASPTPTPTPVSGAVTPTPTPTPAGTTTPGSGGSTAGPGPSPGPAILYAGAANAPQLTNTGIWVAPPILESGASAYRDGEYLYQDFLFDDHGANGNTPDNNQTNELNANTLARPAGTYTYPTDPRYGGNAADIVEFRMKPTAGATAFRLTFNTMIDPSVVAFTIGLGGSSTSYPMPHGANASEPADVFLTVHGASADVIAAPSGSQLGSTPPTVTVDQVRRQITVLLPYSTYDTRDKTALRVAVAAGLWNAAAGAYLVPSQTSSATAPGGAGSLASPPAFFNVGFRHAEPANGANDPSSQTSYWREGQQSTVIASGNLSPFFDTVDMTKLAAGASDDMNGQPQGVPLTGHIDRILASHYEPFQGRKFTGCQGLNGPCPPEYGNQLQPYSVYVPTEGPPSKGYPLTLLLHSLSVNYNQYQNTNNEKQFGERNGGSLVFTTEARGPDNWYYNLAAAEVFEVWADVARHYAINSNSVALTGYSMGGYATFKLGCQFPDLFDVLQPTVGPAYAGGSNGGSSDTKPMYGSLRNLPILSWHASADELVPTADSEQEEAMDSTLGLNFEWDLFSPAEHLTLAINDQYNTAATFLGARSNNINPPHVTYVYNPSMDDAANQLVADHAYWVSNITQRDKTQVTGTIDVFSQGFGVGDPPTSGTTTTSGTLVGGAIPAIGYTGFKNTYGTPPTTPVADGLKITATNISAATINPNRALVDCNAALNVTTDGPLTITLDGCTNGIHTFARGRHFATPPAFVPRTAVPGTYGPRRRP